MKSKFKKMIPFILAAITVLLFGACAQNDNKDVTTTKADATPTTAAAAEYKKITPAEAKALMDAGDVIILDVRTQEEFDQGHIKDAVLIPDYEIGAKAATVLPNKNAKILVYCRSGNRSKFASEKLLAMGYTDVLDFGGIIDWPYETVK